MLDITYGFMHDQMFHSQRRLEMPLRKYAYKCSLQAPVESQRQYYRDLYFLNSWLLFKTGNKSLSRIVIFHARSTKERKQGRPDVKVHSCFNFSWEMVKKNLSAFKSVLVNSGISMHIIKDNINMDHVAIPLV